MRYIGRFFLRFVGFSVTARVIQWAANRLQIYIAIGEDSSWCRNWNLVKRTKKHEIYMETLSEHGPLYVNAR